MAVETWARIHQPQLSDMIFEIDLEFWKDDADSFFKIDLMITNFETKCPNNFCRFPYCYFEIRMGMIRQDYLVLMIFVCIYIYIKEQPYNICQYITCNASKGLSNIYK